jgi:hypothetical protein
MPAILKRPPRTFWVIGITPAPAITLITFIHLHCARLASAGPGLVRR